MAAVSARKPREHPTAPPLNRRVRGSASCRQRTRPRSSVKMPRAYLASPAANAPFLRPDMPLPSYEVITADEARAVSGLGVDHIGVLVGDGAFPREQFIEQARKIFAAISAPSKSSALSLSADLNWISNIVSEVNPDILHLGAHTD